MYLEYNNKKYNCIITYKNIKNMYLRVKEDLKIYISCNRFISDREINRFINSNYSSITKQLDKYEERNTILNNKVQYLGNTYEIVYIKENKVILANNYIYLNKNINFEKWSLKQAKNMFLERLNYCYSLSQEKVPYPILKIRKMKSKWGVCNITSKTITLNLYLIKYDVKYLDYVIIHELTHFLYQNHSKDFWKMVEKYEKNYKTYRKEMKNMI